MGKQTETDVPSLPVVCAQVQPDLQPPSHVWAQTWPLESSAQTPESHSAWDAHAQLDPPGQESVASASLVADSPSVVVVSSATSLPGAGPSESDIVS